MRLDEETREHEAGHSESEQEWLEEDRDDDPETSLRWLGVREGCVDSNLDAEALFE